MDTELRQLERLWRERGDQESREAYARGLQRSGEDKLVFVYRSGYEGPSRKRIVVFDDCTGALEWFRSCCETALGWTKEQGDGWSVEEQAAEYEFFDIADDLVTKLCGGAVYGLGSVFDRTRSRNLPLPASWDDLRKLLEQHLYTEGVAVVSEPTVRVMTDDDEVTLAYFFLPQSYAILNPDRTEYLLREEWELPVSAGTTSDFEFKSERPPPKEVTPKGTGEGVTYIVQLSDNDSGFLFDLKEYPAASALPGVRIPDLPGYLRKVDANEEWPEILLALRTALSPEDADLALALGRCKEHGVELLAPVCQKGSYARMRKALGKAWPELSQRSTKLLAKAGRMACAPHLLQLATSRDWSWGDQKVHYHDQWIVFDDLWATQHPHLAQSLLRYATQWDPLGDWDKDPIHGYEGQAAQA